MNYIIHYTKKRNIVRWLVGITTKGLDVKEELIYTEYPRHVCASFLLRTGTVTFII